MPVLCAARLEVLVNDHVQTADQFFAGPDGSALLTTKNQVYAPGTLQLDSYHNGVMRRLADNPSIVEDNPSCSCFSPVKCQLLRLPAPL